MSNKHPDGYIPKIKYWKSRLESATTSYDKAKANSKLAYFVTQHTSKYGPLNTEELSPPDWNTQANYDRLRREGGGSFYTALIDAFFKADNNNKPRLVKAFPEIFIPQS